MSEKSKTSIEISRKIYDKLEAVGNRKESIEQTIGRLIELSENKRTEKIPEEFSDYGQLEKCINQIGFIEYRKTGPGIDTVKVRIVESDKITSWDAYYKLQDGKFVQCRGENSLENVESEEGVK